MSDVKPERDIAPSSLPGEQITNIETEEQLKVIANTFEENSKHDCTENHIPKQNIEEKL